MRRSFKKGIVLPSVLVFASVGVLIVGGLISWSGTQIKSTRVFSYKEQILHIAEAGIEYYRWHLAHAPQDYTDGSTTTGPYIHVFNDKNGNRIGQFSLDIIPPPLGSTLVTVESTGILDEYPNYYRKIKAQFAKPSIAKYAIVANADIRFGAGTEIFGPVHSNGGIRFDGLAHNLVTSAKSSYVDPDTGGSPRYGVYTQIFPVDPYPPVAVPTRLDVFMAGRQFPVAGVDFAGITSDLSSIKSDSQSDGVYIAPSGSQGYRIVFKTNGTFDLYRVTNLLSLSSTCSSNSGGGSTSGWGSWSIRTNNGQTFVANYPNPDNGLIFVEDNLWVEGQISNARMTIVSAKFPVPATPPSITVNNDVLYTHYDGTDSLSLIAQGNMNVGYDSKDNLRIDAALIAQNGRAGRYYYASSCGSSYIRSALTLYGMIATNQRYGFAYTNGTGYINRSLVYDSNLLYSPPPSFPLTTDQYYMISWQEIR
jgi:hypothetical protein